MEPHHNAPVRTLRAMTYNILHGAGIDWRVKLARTARVIREAGVDVAALQEVDRHYDARSGFIDQAAWLARTLGRHVVFGANIDLDPSTPDGPRRQFGNAIISTEPALDWENTHLPRFGDQEQRGLLRARIPVHGLVWQVCTTHLQHNDAAARLAQAQAVAQLIGAPEQPVVLLADLNAASGTPEVRVLADRLLDAWQAAGTGPGYTYRNPVPYRRIDYIMHAPAGHTRTACMPRSLRARIASDHLPVIAELEAGPRASDSETGESP